MTPFTFMTSTIWALLIVVTPQTASATDAKSAIPQLSGLDCTPTTVSSSGSTNCTVSLSTAVPGIINKGGEPVVVFLTSPSGSRDIPILPGQTHGSALIQFNNSSPVSVQAVIQAQYKGLTKAVTVTISPNVHVLKSLAIQPWQGIGGTPNYAPKGTVTLTAPAPQGGLKVRLGGDSPAVVVVPSADITAMGAPTTVVIIPSAVTVPSGQTEASFPIVAKPVASSTSVKITASVNWQGDVDQTSKTMGVNPPHLSSHLVINGFVNDVPLGGMPVMVTASLDSPAGPGTFFQLSYTGTGFVSGPPQVEVPAGHTEGKWTVTVLPCETEGCYVTITARFNGDAAVSSIPLHNSAAAASTSSQVGQAGATPTVRWITAPNATLKEAVGRLKVTFLKEVEYRFSNIEIFPESGTTATKKQFGNTDLQLPPGHYDIAVSGARVAQVPVTLGTDTRLLVGALRIQAGEKTRVEVWDAGRTKLLVWTIGNGAIGLPIGPYAIKIGKGVGAFADVMIEDGKITDFRAP